MNNKDAPSTSAQWPVAAVAKIIDPGAFAEENHPYWMGHVRSETRVNSAMHRAREIVDLLTASTPPAASPASPSSDVVHEVGRDDLKRRAKQLLTRNGWKPGDQFSAHSTVELMVALAIDAVKNPPDRCGWPECGCCHDASCDEAVALASDATQAPTSGSEDGGDCPAHGLDERAWAAAFNAYHRTYVGDDYTTLREAIRAYVTALAKPASEPAGGDVREACAATCDVMASDEDQPYSVRTAAASLAAEIRAGAALSSSAGPAATWTANCCHCGRIVDTRETTQGGDDFGCELTDGRWTCSPECWEAVVEPAPTSGSEDELAAFYQSWLDNWRKKLGTLAKPASEPAGGDVEGDLVSRSEVLRVIRSLGDQDADLALYGAADNARSREYGEASATRACCAIALMPAALSSSAGPAVEIERLTKERDDAVERYGIATAEAAKLRARVEEQRKTILRYMNEPIPAHPAPATVESVRALPYLIHLARQRWDGNWSYTLQELAERWMAGQFHNDAAESDTKAAALAPATEGRKETN